MFPRADSRVPETNRLLALLPSTEYETLKPDLHLVELDQKQPLSTPNEPITDIYFPRGAVVSMLAPMENGDAVEGATIGWEGFTGVPVFLGAAIAQEAVVCQIPGQSWRMKADVFRAAAAHNPGLHEWVHRYTLALMGQLIRTAGCNRAHPIEERCARWLLMTADRVGANHFPLTQEFLAAMLGVRRPSVTLAAGLLQEAGLIRYRRGLMTILDRERLEQSSCEDYRLTRDLYDSMYDSARDGAQSAEHIFRPYP
jgi:CRP-like cAMP-binding protein